MRQTVLPLSHLFGLSRVGTTIEADSASTLTVVASLVLVARMLSTSCDVTLRSRFGKHAV